MPQLLTRPPHQNVPPDVVERQFSATFDSYRKAVKADGIPFRCAAALPAYVPMCQSLSLSCRWASQPSSQASLQAAHDIKLEDCSADLMACLHKTTPCFKSWRTTLTEH